MSDAERCPGCKALVDALNQPLEIHPLRLSAAEWELVMYALFYARDHAFHPNSSTLYRLRDLCSRVGDQWDEREREPQ